MIAFAEEGSFAAAAQVVHLSQAAVSMQMRSLEDELQISLFDRNKRPPELSHAGLTLVPKAREIIRAYDNFINCARDDENLGGELVLGAIPTSMSGLMPKALVSLTEEYPDLRIRITPGLSSELLPQIERGFLDAAIVSEPAQPMSHLNWAPIAEEPLVLLMSQSIPDGDPRELLETHPFIRFTRQAWVGRQIDQWLLKQRIRVHERMELDSLDAISVMVFNQLGISIVPRNCVRSPQALPLKRLSLGPSVKPRVIGLLSRRGGTKANLLDVVHQSLVKVVKSEGDMATDSLEIK